MPREPLDSYGYRLREILRGEPLNDREVEVLLWAARGLTAKQTGARIFLAADTVKSYRKQAAAKLAASSITHSVVLALDAGVLTLEGIRDDRDR